MTDNTMREALKAMFKAGFIEAAQWGSPSSQDVDSPALNAAMAERVEPTITALEWQSQQAQGEQLFVVLDSDPFGNLSFSTIEGPNGEEVNLPIIERDDGFLHIGPLFEHPPTPAAVPEDKTERVRDAIAEAIGFGAYDCIRVWSAWSVGTMGPDDFIPITEDEDRMAEIAEAAISALATPAPADPDKDDQQSALFRARSGAED